MAVVVPIVTTFNAKGINKAIADFKKLESTGQKVAFGMRGVDQATGSLVKGMAKAGAAIGLVGGIIGTKLVSAAYESQKVMRTTEQLIKTTGGAAKISAQGVSELSTKLSELTGVDDELVQSSANLLLTFKQVKNEAGANNDIFNQAVGLTLDLGNLFGSATGAAMQLGKALADPTRGVTALRKAGINFTEAQQIQIKKLVETGDLLGAQKIVLGEVQSQVGGLAAATATDFDKMKVAVGNVSEDFGALLLPAVESISRYITDKTVPFFRELAGVIGKEGLGAGISFASDALFNFITNMNGTATAIFFVVGAIGALRAATIAYNIVMGLSSVILPVFMKSLQGATAAQTQLNVAMYANPIGLIVAAVVAFIAVMVVLYMKFEIVRKAVNFLGDALMFIAKNAIAVVANYFITFINVAITGLNLLIKAANFFGADFQEIGYIGYVAFSGISTGAKNATKDIYGVQEGLRAVRNEERALEGKALLPPVEPPGGGGGAAKTIETAKQKLEKYMSALEKVTGASERLMSANKAITTSQKRVAEATKNVQKAQDDLTKSVEAVAEAEANLDRVRSGLGAGSVESQKAARAVSDAQRELEDAGYSVEDAQFALIDAEAELTALRENADSTTRDLREAEINLARAKITLTEAQLKQTDQTIVLKDLQTEFNEITNGASEGTDRYKEAMDALTEAKRANEEASKALEDAKQSEIDANENLEDSVKNLTKAQWDLFDAEKALAELRNTTPKGVVSEAEAEAKKRESAVPVNTLPFASFMAAVRALHPNSPSLNAPDQLTASKSRFPALYKQYQQAGLAFANGGIVTKPTIGLIGEAGAEAIIPLDQMQTGTTINISVNAGMGADGGHIGNQIVDALKKYQRRNGAIPITVTG